MVQMAFATRAVERTDTERDAEVVLAADGMAFDPAHEAHKLRITGMPWREVAHKTGYPTADAAAGAVARYLQKAAGNMTAEQQHHALTLQIDRYEAILNNWWEAGAGAGRDDSAATIVLRTMAQLDKIQRLGEPDVVVSKETIVISADPEEYVRQLKEMGP